MDPATLGLVGGIGGSVLGVVGAALIGTYCGIVNTKTDGERRFMIRCSVVGWLLMAIFIVAPIVLVATKILPNWIYWGVYPVFMTASLGSLPVLNRRAAALRESVDPR